MACKNDKELTKQIRDIMEGAVREAQLKAYDVVKSFINEYYKEYDPKEYQRTYAFFKSLVRSEIKKTATGYQCSVYLDPDLMDEYFYHSGEEVLDMINRGFHADPSMSKPGYEPKSAIEGTPLWEFATEEIDRTDLIMRTFKEHFDKNMR